MNQKPLVPHDAGVKIIIKDPISNKARAPMNIVLKFKLFNIHGLMGMDTHITSMNPVVNHCTVDAEIPNARIKVG